MLTIGLEPIRVSPTDFKSVVFTISPSKRGYRLKVNYLPSKQKIWVRFPLSANKNKSTMPRKLPLKKFRSFAPATKPPKSNKKLESKRLFSLIYGAISQSQYNKLIRKNISKTAGALRYAERRLDVVVARMFLFKTIQSARQYINHNGISVNNRILNRPSALLKPGDIVQIRNPQKYLGMNLLIQNPLKFPHLEVSYKTFTGIFLFSPQQIYSNIPRLFVTETGLKKA